MARPSPIRRTVPAVLLLAALVLLGLLASTATAAKIPLTSAEGFPNGRTSNDPPAYAIDGNTGTATWTTEALNTTSPAYLAVDFPLGTATRIRLFKSAEGGGGPNVKNLVIQYTNGTGPLSSRAWTNVRNLQSGYNGAEPFQAVSVNAGGTVTRTRRSIVGFGSLSFDPVSATGIRIGFSNPFSGGSCNSNPSGPCRPLPGVRARGVGRRPADAHAVGAGPRSAADRRAPALPSHRGLRTGQRPDGGRRERPGVAERDGSSARTTESRSRTRSTSAPAGPCGSRASPAARSTTSPATP